MRTKAPAALLVAVALASAGSLTPASAVTPRAPVALSALAGLPLVRLSSSGPTVVALQQALRAAGYAVTADGRFGPATQAAVIAFQQKAHLSPDGVVGTATWAALDGTPPPGPTPAPTLDRPRLSLGASGEGVRALQTALTRAGFAVGIDGRFGSGTQRKVQAFQASRKLVADGVVGATTWAALDAAPPVHPPNASTTTVAPTTTTTVGVRPLSMVWRTFGTSDYTVAAGDTWTSIAAKKGSTGAAIAEANRAAARSKPTVGSIVQVRGAWRCPTAGTFINDWGFVRSGGRKHEGNDLFAPRNTPVVAPVAGNVVQSPNGLGGNAIQLYGDDGNRYYLAHLESYAAKGRVSAGTLIGAVGNSGNAITTVTHMHFEIHPGGGVPVNPYPTLLLACRG